MHWLRMHKQEICRSHEYLPDICGQRPGIAPTASATLAIEPARWNVKVAARALVADRLASAEARQLCAAFPQKDDCIWRCCQDCRGSRIAPGRLDKSRDEKAFARFVRLHQRRHLRHSSNPNAFPSIRNNEAVVQGSDHARCICTLRLDARISHSFKSSSSRLGSDVQQGISRH